MWTREQLKNNAKINMKRNYWSCVAVAFIMSVVEGCQKRIAERCDG